MIVNFITGMSASMLHVVAGPDHLAAVTPLALKSRLRSWLVGLFWGIGHTIGALTIGLLFILLRELIPVELISSYSEQIVGFMLILIGAWALWQSLRKKEAKQHHHHEIAPGRSIVAALTIGIIHGLAGVSHLIGVLPTLALPSRMAAVIYLTGFAVGTISTMVIYAFLLGYLTHRTARQNKMTLLKRMNLVGGVFAIIVGIYWIGSTL